MNQINENENKGFSLVELIVVIAIMAVLTSVLAPSLLGYVEKSRMQKDDSAMGEVTNAIKLALADQDVYDECLTYSIKGNKSCYVDGTYTADTTNAIIDKASKDSTSYGTGADENQWHFNDTTRQKDETKYAPAGNMRGLTITFPTGGGSNAAVFVMANARINEIETGKDNSGTAIPSGKNVTLNTMDADTAATTKRAYLYNKLRAVIGDNITLTSQTYRNSEYTVFIRMGSMGGNQASAQDAVAVYGQWNGTNL